MNIDELKEFDVKLCRDCKYGESGFNEVCRKCKNLYDEDEDEYNEYQLLWEKKINRDAVNHPKHYNREGAMECIDEMVLLFGIEEAMAFCKLSAWKYRYRAGEKDDAKQDMKKSDNFLKMYKELKEVLKREVS